jgi:DNA-directed RNA polymerase specialized sigma subunit
VGAAIPSREPGPVGFYEQHLRQEAVRQVLALLRGQVPEINYQVFHMRCIEELTTGQIAAKLQLLPSQISLCVHRMKKRFRRLFEQTFGKDIISLA